MGFSPRKLLPLLAAACALVVGLAACGGEDARTSEDVPVDAIALVGDQEVPKSEFEALMDRAETTYKQQKRPFPKAGTREYNDLKNRAVAFLVQRYQFREEAEEMGVEVTEKEVDKRLEELKKQLFGGNEKKFQQELEKQGLTPEQAREEIRDRILQEKIYKAVTKDVKVTDQEIEKYYEENEEQFKQPATREVRHILVKNKAKAQELHAQLEDGANFAQLAKQHSQDPGSKAQGGKLPVTKGQTVPPFDKVAFSLEKGEISEPVKTTFGWHIIQPLSKVKPEKVTPLADVKPSIRQQLLQQQQNEAMTKWVKDLEEKYEDEIVYAAGYKPPKTETDTGATTAQQ